MFNLFKKKEEPKPTVQAEPKKPKPISNSGMIYLAEQEHEEEFFETYKKNFNATDWYKLTKKELKEDFEGEKVYKYYPYTLDYEIVGNDVFAPLKGTNVKIGTLTDEQIEIVKADGGVLNLYQNIYKEVYDDVEIIEDEPFFGIYVKKYNIFK